ncbi:MAG: discoidin domain-containing protein [Flavobacteriales bacterium]|nr:discoidin domain-containing protein [Flavobacteriales bacterium]
MKIKYFLSILIAVALSFKSYSQTVEEIVATLDIEVLMNNGPKDNRINIAIANLTNPEGTHTYETKAALDADIALILAYFDINNPDNKRGFSQYRNFFNVHSVFFPDPLVFETIPSFYESANGVRDALFLPFADEEHGWATMLYSLDGGGGGGAGVDRAKRTGFAQLYGLDAHTVFHEFNHTMPGVSDEYTASGAWNNFVSIEGSNLTGKTVLDEIPWRKWIDPSLQLPTPYKSSYTNEIGLFEGNISGYFGSYRPTARSCFMGAGGFGDNYGQNMCSICLQRFVTMLYKYVNVIENPLPASQNITVDGNETVTFSANILKPEPNTQKYKWFVNGVLYQEDVESIDVTFNACNNYTVELVVSDETEFVRYDEKFKNLYPEPKQSHIWTIDQTAVSDYNLAIATTVTNADCTGLANGSISIEPSGGTAPYEIFVDGVTRTSPVADLIPGIHSIVVSDANGCSVTEEVEVIQDPILDFGFISSSYAGLWNISVQNIIEDNNPVDEATIEYLWSTGSTAPTIQVPTGTYSVRITSSTGCVVIREITVSEISNPLGVFVTASHASNSDNNGSISLELNYGKKPYEIIWSEKLFTDQTSPVADQVISSGSTNGHVPIRAFDNSDEHINFWAAGFTGNNYIGFDLKESIEIEAYSVTSNDDVKGRDAKSWILQGSDDETNWLDIETITNFEFPERKQRFEFKLNQPTSYRYFRLLITENWGDGWLAIKEVEFASFEYYEMPQFKNQNEAIDLAPTFYKYQIKDVNSSCFEEIIEIKNIIVSLQPIEVSQNGNYQVQVNNPNPNYTYHWASKADMTGRLHTGTSFQPDNPGPYYVQAYETSLSTFASVVKGFAITMPDVPELIESGGTLTIVNPKGDHEYIWYDQSKSGVELHNGTTFTPSSDGYYFAATRKPLPVIVPIDPRTISGITLWADASDLDGNGVTNDVLESSAAHDWLFKQGGRFREGNFFIYRDNYQNGLGVADFSTIWLQSLDNTTNRLRTVILVYEENNLSLTGTAPFTGLDEVIPRHSDASQLFANSAPSTTLDGRVYLNGELVNPLTTANPMKFMVLSSVFTELVLKDVNRTAMEWDGKVGELIVWDVELTHEQVVGVNEFLRKKWLSTAHLESARTKISWGPNPLEDKDSDGYTEDVDCDDNNPNVNPGATEICDGIDNNCDGVIDEGFSTTFYADLDKDGFGDINSTIKACEAPNGYVDNRTDCDDTNAGINPDETDIPNNGIDEDCDGSDSTVLDVLDHHKDEFSIYPNPARNFINVKINNKSDYTVSLYDVLGSLVVQKKNTTRLAIQNVQDGVYLLVITFHNSGQPRIVQTVIVQK